MNEIGDKLAGVVSSGWNGTSEDVCALSGYPITNESGYVNPNLTPYDIILESEGTRTLYPSYLSNDNIICEYQAKNPPFHTSVLGVNFSGKSGLKHQIFNNGELIISGDNLYKVYTASSNFTVEYFKDEFSEITGISASTFSYCDIITVRLPYYKENNGIKIGDSAFQSCSYLTTFFNYSSIHDVGDYAFYYCTSLTGNEVACSPSTDVSGYCNIDESYKLISGTSNVLKVCYDCGTSAFEGCSGLDTIAFYGRGTSGNLSTPINIGPYNIGDSAFKDCGEIDLRSYEINSDGSYEFSSNEIVNVSSIGASAFTGCELGSDGSIWFGFKNDDTSATLIGEYAFYGMSGLTSVGKINDGEYQKINCDQIGDNAFGGLGIVDYTTAYDFLFDLVKPSTIIDDYTKRIFGYT